MIVAATTHPILPLQLGLFAGVLLAGLLYTWIEVRRERRRRGQVRTDYHQGVFLSTEIWTDEMEDWLRAMDNKYGSLPPHRTQATVAYLDPSDGKPVYDATTNRYRARLDWLHDRLDK